MPGSATSPKLDRESHRGRNSRYLSWKTGEILAGVRTRWLFQLASIAPTLGFAWEKTLTFDRQNGKGSLVLRSMTHSTVPTCHASGEAHLVPSSLAPALAISRQICRSYSKPMAAICLCGMRIFGSPSRPQPLIVPQINGLNASVPGLLSLPSVRPSCDAPSTVRRAARDRAPSECSRCH